MTSTNTPITTPTPQPMVRLNIWENTQNSDWVMVLYDFQTPTGKESQSASLGWRKYYTFLAYNPLVPPYPAGSELFRARHSMNYPYELREIKSVRDVYHVDEPGTYFVAYTAPYPGMSKIPFGNTYVYVQSGEFLRRPRLT